MRAGLLIIFWILGWLLGGADATDAQCPISVLRRSTHPVRGSVSGVRLYQTPHTYHAGDIAAGRDGSLYRALKANRGKDPAQDDGSHWHLAHAAANLTLAVPARFANITAAWTFLQAAAIPQGCIVTIQVADGTYRLASAVMLNHPSGSRIHLVGNAVNPKRCTLVWPANQDGLVVSGNHSLGLIQGFTLVGQAAKSVPPYIPAGEALAAYEGATVNARNVVCSQWWHGFHASDNSDMVCTDCSTIAIGDAGFFCYNGGTMKCRRCTGAAGNGGYPLGFGFLAELASSMFLSDCRANGGNTAAGIGGFTNSSLEIRACTSRDNHQGLWLDGGSVAEITTLDCSSNTLNNTSASPTGGAHGILLQGGSKVKSGSSGITSCFNGGRGLLARDNSVFMAQGSRFSHNYSGLFAENNSSIDATNLTAQSNTYEGVLAVNNSIINLGTSSTIMENGIAGFGYAVNYAPIAGEWGNNNSYIQTTPYVNPVRPLLTGSSPYVGSPPARMLGIGAGVEAISSGSGRDMGGQIVVTTGANPVGSAPIVTVTFARAYSSAPVVVICAADASSAEAMTRVYVRSSPAGFTLHATAPALAAHKTYAWNYFVPGN